MITRQTLPLLAQVAKVSVHMKGFADSSRSTKDIAAEINEGGQMVKVEAYGTGNCADLAAADWHGKPAENAAENADNYAFIAAGMFYKT